MAQFPEPLALNILEIGDGGRPNPGAYSLEKPHPGYGVDPYIINQLGHSIYPKMIYPNGKESAGVVAKNEKEEAELTGKKVETVKAAW
jgi:hypothetical protein